MLEDLLSDSKVKKDKVQKCTTFPVKGAPV